MDLHIKPLARQSSISGVAFAVGQQVYSLLCVLPDGALQRYDVTEAEASSVEIVGTLLCRWSLEVRPEAEDPEAGHRQQALETAEAMFEGLYESYTTQALASGDLALLLNLLALHLERRRVLKSIRRGKQIIYRNSAKNAEYTLPRAEWTPAALVKIQEQLDAVV